LPSALFSVAAELPKSVTTKVIRVGQEAQKLVVNVSGMDDLWLQATSGDDDYHHDRAVWGDPILIDKEKTQVDLTKIKPVGQKMGHGGLMIDKGLGTNPLKIGTKTFSHGFFAHAPSFIHFKLGGKYEVLQVSVGIENAGQDGGSCEFRVLAKYDDTRMQPYPKGNPKTARSRAQQPASVNTESLEMAIKDMAATWPDRFKDADKLLAELKTLRESSAGKESMAAFQKRVLLRNPLLDFDRLLVVRRKKGNAFPANWQSNSSIGKTGHDNELVMLSIKNPGEIKTVHRPESGAFMGDVDLNFKADKVLFSSMGKNGAWQVMEIDVDGTGLRQVTTTEDKGINNYDACYLPDGRIMFTSTAPYVAVPCVNGSAPVANLFRCNPDGSDMDQLTFDQEHAWCPQVMDDGKILYLRWEYADLPHSNSRILMTMNPDGTNQRSYYGTSSFWPNGIFYARQVPGKPSMFAGIITGHHGVRREGELVLFDTDKGYMEADGVVQRIPGYGKPVEPVVRDGLANGSKPRFLHPYPLSDKYFLASSNLEGGWNVYLVDVFDNMTPIVKEQGVSILEPIPLQPTPLPRIVPDKIIKGRKDATVFISDIYEGPGLKDVTRGEVKALRIFSYTYGYPGMGGLYGVIGMDGPWDMRRILGTVPVEADGSAVFKIPANIPISLQPLDAEGKALQIMRSWIVARPGENLSCIGCHEPPGATPAVRVTKAARKGPVEIKPWLGPARNYEFKREVQPVLDKYCLSCHASSKPADGKLTITHKGKELPYLGGDVRLKGWGTKHHGRGAGGNFSVSYFNLFRYTRHSGEESEMKLLTPMEFHADTCELIMILEKGHHGVTLDNEARNRLAAWIDLNTPYHGRWSEVRGSKGTQAEARRAEMRALYAGVVENHEEMPELPAPVKPVPPKPSTIKHQPLTIPPKASPIPGTATRTIPLAEGVSIELAYIPSGSFAMGSVSGHHDEGPMTKQEIKTGFWMARTEISNRQFAQFDSEHDSRHEDRHGYQFGVTGYPVNEPDMPAVRVNWNQANAFCKWLSGKSGLKVSLPSEAQWEWACRAGTTTAMNYGDVDADFAKHGNMGDINLHNFSGNPYVQDWRKATFNNPQNIFDNWIPQAGSVNDGGFISTAVGHYEPNAWGLHDMHGNAAEWTASLYEPYPYEGDDGRNDPLAKGKRVVRGGSWYDRPKLCTTTFRRAYRDYQKVYNVGFRVVVVE
jgi:formylglycine-generating enzyme required for sulfatase activity